MSAPRTTALSPRQLRIVELAARGLADKQIAAELGMAWGTTRTHWQRIFSRLQIHTRAEAVFAWALLTTAAPVLQLPVSKSADKTTRRHLRK